MHRRHIRALNLSSLPTYSNITAQIIHKFYLRRKPTSSTQIWTCLLLGRKDQHTFHSMYPSMYILRMFACYSANLDASTSNFIVQNKTEKLISQYTLKLGSNNKLLQITHTPTGQRVSLIHDSYLAKVIWDAGTVSFSVLIMKSYCPRKECRT